MKNEGVVLYYAGMVGVQLAYGGSNILIKIAFNRGLDPFVLVVYRHLIAMLVLALFVYVLERNQRPSLSVALLAKLILRFAYARRNAKSARKGQK